MPCKVLGRKVHIVEPYPRRQGASRRDRIAGNCAAYQSSVTEASLSDRQNACDLIQKSRNNGEAMQSNFNMRGKRILRGHALLFMSITFHGTLGNFLCISLSEMEIGMRWTHMPRNQSEKD